MHYKDVWYNAAANMSSTEYPVIFDEKQNYIDCEIGLKCVMGKTKDGRRIYYKVTKIWRSKGSDFLYPSDATHCSMKFSHVESKTTNYIDKTDFTNGQH